MARSPDRISSGSSCALPARRPMPSRSLASISAGPAVSKITSAGGVSIKAAGSAGATRTEWSNSPSDGTISAEGSRTLVSRSRSLNRYHLRPERRKTRGQHRPDPDAARITHMTKVTVRYWAAAKEAAGVAEETLEADTLAGAIAAALARRGEDPRLRAVLARSSFLVDGSAVGRRGTEEVVLPAAAVIEVLPPFAGG